MTYDVSKLYKLSVKVLRLNYSRYTRNSRKNTRHASRNTKRDEKRRDMYERKHVVKMQSKDNLKKVFALPRQKKLFDRRSFHYQVLAKSESVKESNETQGI